MVFQRDLAPGGEHDAERGDDSGAVEIPGSGLQREHTGSGERHSAGHGAAGGEDTGVMSLQTNQSSFWTPPREWEGQDAHLIGHLIGGGPDPPDSNRFRVNVLRVGTILPPSPL